LLVLSGVIGLSTAIKIQDKGGYKVSIVAEIFPTDPKDARYASHFAVRMVFRYRIQVNLFVLGCTVCCQCFSTRSKTKTCVKSLEMMFLLDCEQQELKKIPTRPFGSSLRQARRRSSIFSGFNRQNSMRPLIRHILRIFEAQVPSYLHASFHIYIFFSSIGPWKKTSFCQEQTKDSPLSHSPSTRRGT
jgi:hypothetical protein